MFSSPRRITLHPQLLWLKHERKCLVVTRPSGYSRGRVARNPPPSNPTVGQPLREIVFFPSVYVAVYCAVKREADCRRSASGRGKEGGKLGANGDIAALLYGVTLETHRLLSDERAISKLSHRRYAARISSRRANFTFPGINSVMKREFQGYVS